MKGYVDSAISQFDAETFNKPKILRENLPKIAFGLYNNISAKKGSIEEFREVISDLIEENNSLKEESGELKISHSGTGICYQLTA